MRYSPDTLAGMEKKNYSSAVCNTLIFGVGQGISCIVGARLEVSNSFPPIEAKGCPVICPTKSNKHECQQINGADKIIAMPMPLKKMSSENYFITLQLQLRCQRAQDRCTCM